jgi:hypothetical protein
LSLASFNYWISPTSEHLRQQITDVVESFDAEELNRERLDFEIPLICFYGEEELSASHEFDKYYQDVVRIKLSRAPVAEFSDYFVVDLEQERSLQELVELLYIILSKKKKYSTNEKLQRGQRKISDLASFYIEQISGKCKFLGDEKTEKSEFDAIISVYSRCSEIYKGTFEASLKDGSSIFSDFGIQSIKTLSEKELPAALEQKNEVVLPLTSMEDNGFILFSIAPILTPKLAFTIRLIHQELEKYFLRTRRTKEHHKSFSLWEDVFSKLEAPTGVISEQGEVIVCNSSFSQLKMTPRNCLALKDQQTFESGHFVYQVFKTKLEVGESVSYLFVFESAETSSISSSELGIITGSLAHELNNPLAGILAAISLLELDDDLGEEAQQSLKEMKESARRCKNLVEIFLGFARTNESQLDPAVIDQALEEALNLLRFRMVESGFRLELTKQSTTSGLNRPLNKSSLAMIFYLLLSEVITHYSRYELIRDGAGGKGSLLCSWHETAQNLVFNFQESWLSQSELPIPKLLGHLLEKEGLEIECRGQSIVLRNSSLI